MCIIVWRNNIDNDVLQVLLHYSSTVCSRAIHCASLILWTARGACLLPSSTFPSSQLFMHTPQLFRVCASGMSTDVNEIFMRYAVHITNNLYANTKTAKIPLSTSLAIGLLHESVQLLLKIAQYRDVNPNPR